jgi:hypothetical protein
MYEIPMSMRYARWLTTIYDTCEGPGDPITWASEAIDNTWKGVLNLVTDDWSLNMGRFFLSLTAFKARTKKYVLEQGLEVGTTRSRDLALYLGCPEWTFAGKIRWQPAARGMSIMTP